MFFFLPSDKGAILVMPTCLSPPSQPDSLATTFFSLLLLTSLQPFSAVPPTSPSTSASLFSLLVVTFHPPMLLYTVHINECERSPCCSESYWEDVCGCACMCMWAHMLRFVCMVRDSAWRTGWRHQRPREDVYWWRNPVNEERRMRASTRHSNLYLNL